MAGERASARVAETPAHPTRSALGTRRGRFVLGSVLSVGAAIWLGVPYPDEPTAVLMGLLAAVAVGVRSFRHATGVGLARPARTALRLPARRLVIAFAWSGLVGVVTFVAAVGLILTVWYFLWVGTL